MKIMVARRAFSLPFCYHKRAALIDRALTVVLSAVRWGTKAGVIISGRTPKELHSAVAVE